MTASTLNAKIAEFAEMYSARIPVPLTGDQLSAMMVVGLLALGAQADGELNPAETVIEIMDHSPLFSDVVYSMFIYGVSYIALSHSLDHAADLVDAADMEMVEEFRAKVDLPEATINTDNLVDMIAYETYQE